MREIDLNKYKIRTDLITDITGSKKHKNIKEIIRYKGDIKISNITLKKDEPLINRKKGLYTTISFNDITDSDNYSKVIEVLTSELNKFLSKMNVKKEDSILIVGLGNIKSTPDMLGPKVLEHIIVTSHIKKLTGSLDKAYREVSILAPGVMGITGIETKDIVLGVINNIKPNLLIFIDALASEKLDRLNKTIQITNAGINPGSGVGNIRKELSYDTLGIPIIVIGVPTVVDAVTIVRDTINYMLKNSLKEEKEEILGLVGSLSESELKELLFEVLSSTGYNLMVTPKEIDFIMEKLVNIIATSINKSIHNLK